MSAEGNREWSVKASRGFAPRRSGLKGTTKQWLLRSDIVLMVSQYKINHLQAENIQPVSEIQFKVSFHFLREYGVQFKTAPKSNILYCVQ